MFHYSFAAEKLNLYGRHKKLSNLIFLIRNEVSMGFFQQKNCSTLGIGQKFHTSGTPFRNIFLEQKQTVESLTAFWVETTSKMNLATTS